VPVTNRQCCARGFVTGAGSAPAMATQPQPVLLPHELHV
jgi:hypothetical protein